MDTFKRMIRAKAVVLLACVFVLLLSFAVSCYKSNRQILPASQTVVSSIMR